MGSEGSSNRVSCSGLSVSVGTGNGVSGTVSCGAIQFWCDGSWGW